MGEPTKKTELLPYDLLCPSLTTCGGLLQVYGVDHGADVKPTVHYFVCSNKNSTTNPC